VTGRRLFGPFLVAAFAAFGAVLVASSRAGSRQAAVAGDRAAEAVSAYVRTPLEEEAVTSALAPGLRSATDEDASDSEGREELRILYGDYHPYFVRGDFDADGRLDFAQGFVRRDGPEPLFDVAVFFGTPGGFASPVWIDRGLLLSGGDLSVDRSVLVVTEDVEQEVSRRWRWDPSAGHFVDVDAGNGKDGGEPWTEPDGQLGTTA
jgi:hypothetical protein